MAAPVVRLAHEPSDWRTSRYGPYVWTWREKLSQALTLAAVVFLARRFRR